MGVTVLMKKDREGSLRCFIPRFWVGGLGWWPMSRVRTRLHHMSHVNSGSIIK
ncbi:hypothetical protein Hanom_Chr11g01024431 [Helianthus anomalus]